MKVLSGVLITGGLLYMALPGFASGVSICDGVIGNIVTNCGFEAGVYTSTVGGFTNSDVPDGWTANAAFDEFTSFNIVGTSPVNSGTFALSIGDDDPQPLPVLSQTLTDISGTTYKGSLWVDYGGAGTSDTLPFFKVLINGTTEVNFNSLAPGAYTEYTFSFTGTGSDVLSLEGNTSPVEWFVDDVVVTAGSASSVPEPRSALLLTGGFGAFLIARRKFAKQ
jgi:hypothetical protein